MKCNLKAHLETHKSVEERSFKCSQCSHTATTLPLLRLHMHSHTGERPYVCELCGESYRRPSNLRRHKKNMCKLRPGAPQDQVDEEMGIEGEEEGVYERIETVVVQVTFGSILFNFIWISSKKQFCCHSVTMDPTLGRR